MGRARDRASADLNGQEFILDADADTSISADTDDQIDIKIAGADDFQFTANTFTAQSGSTIAAQALTATTITASGVVKTDDTTDSTSTTTGSIQTDGGVGIAKDLVVGDDILLKSDSASIQFGADSEITLTHSADSGLLLKHAASGDDKFPTLNFQTGDNDIAQNDVLGRLSFTAPDEGAGTDAVLVAAGIDAISQGDFSASSNATSLVFKTANSETAVEKMRLTAAGDIGLGTTSPSAQLHIDEGDSNSYATIRLEGNNRGGQIDMYQGSTIVSQIFTDQSGNLYFASSGGYGQTAIDSTAYMAAENKAFGLRTSEFITTMADDSTKNIVTNGSGLIIISSYTYGRVAIYKHDYIGGPTLITGDTLYYATSNTDGKYSLESGANSFTATLRNRFGGNGDFKVMFIGTYQ